MRWDSVALSVPRSACLGSGRARLQLDVVLDLDPADQLELRLQKIDVTFLGLEDRREEVA